MGRPGLQLTDWHDLKVGELAYFFTGAGWKKGVVQNFNTRSATILYTHGSNQVHVTVSDPRNVRRADNTTGEEGGLDDGDQTSFLDS